MTKPPTKMIYIRPRTRLNIFPIDATYVRRQELSARIFGLRLKPKVKETLPKLAENYKPKTWPLNAWQDFRHSKARRDHLKGFGRNADGDDQGIYEVLWTEPLLQLRG